MKNNVQQQNVENEATDESVSTNLNTVNTDVLEQDSSNGLTQEQEEVLNAFDIPEHVAVDIEEQKSTENAVDEMNESFKIASKMYERVLAPQLRENEELKREQKKELMTQLFKILKLQFWFTYVFVLILIVAVVFSRFLGLTESMVDSVIGFVKFYITTVVAELIAILFFIVKSVFDKSIVELIKDFDKRN